MRTMMTAMASLAAIALAPTAATAGDRNFQPSSFESRAQVFEVADMDGNNRLSRDEYMRLRMNTIDENSVWNYRADTRNRAMDTFAMSFAAMDLDRNGWVSATEFANAPAVASPNPDQRNWGSSPGWDPEYMTVTYYLQANEVDTDMFTDRPVVNLKGEQVGTLEKIIKRDDQDRYYAIIDLDTTPLLATPTMQERSNAGIPLDDILLFDDSNQLMLSTRGEEYLKNADANYLNETEYETVDSLYRIS